MPSKTPYRVREVDGTEQEGLLAWMHYECFGEDAALPDFKVGHWWIAYVGKDPAAFAGMVDSYTEAKGFYLNRSGVLPEHRGRGLQRRLIRARERKARLLGAAVLLSDTTGNPHSSNSLIRCGYRLFDPKYPWFLELTNYWRKDL